MHFFYLFIYFIYFILFCLFIYLFIVKKFFEVYLINFQWLLLFSITSRAHLLKNEEDIKKKVMSSTLK